MDKLTKAAGQFGAPYRAWQAALDVYFNDTPTNEAVPVQSSGQMRRQTLAEEATVPKARTVECFELQEMIDRCTALNIYMCTA